MSTLLENISFSIQYFIAYTGKQPKKLLISYDLEKEIISKAELVYKDEAGGKNKILGLVVETMDSNDPRKYCIY
jgi:hypothetical protein